MLKRYLTLLSIWLSLGSSGWGKVLVRWTEPALPSRSLGVPELVIPWQATDLAPIQAAARHGYRVYVEVPLQQASDAVSALSKEPIAGVIVDPGDTQDALPQMTKLRTAHPKMKFLLLGANGKEPQMRGQTVTTREGVLQVSSATAQPWLDTNLAMVRYERSTEPSRTPVYTFGWELDDSLRKEYGPSEDDYALAIAESGAVGADLILSLHPTLQRGLLEKQPAAWVQWEKLSAYIKFADAEASGNRQPWSNVAVVTRDYDTAYEPMNLMARHNIPFRVLPIGFSADSLHPFSVVIVFAVPDQQGIEVLNSFAKRGETVIIVDAKGKYPWQSAEPVHTAEHAVSYNVGKGRVIELAEPVADPETFAQDVRRLIPENEVLVSLWNALTTIAVPYRDSSTGEVMLDLVNYAQVPMRIQVQVKGSYSNIRYETPDHGCCQNLVPVRHDGFTDFVIPSLVIAGRVHLKPATTPSRPGNK